MSGSEFPLKPWLARQAARVESALAACLPPEGRDTRLTAAMRHSLMAGGKRLRPILCLAAAACTGERDDTAAMPAARALELIHTYSLIHDDLPAMDDDDLRRGRPACHKAFDEATAILAGDALLTLAFSVLSHTGPDPFSDPAAAADIIPGRRLSVIRELAAAAGMSGMVEGQMRDMAAEHRKLELEELRALYSLKTGALIRAAVRCGAISSGADEAELAALTVYAEKIGLAFQVTDDILNITGDPEKLGKAVGTDANRGKNTCPLLMGLDRARKFAAELAADAITALNDSDAAADPLRAIAGYILRRQR